MVDFVSLSIKAELLRALCSVGWLVQSLIECRTQKGGKKSLFFQRWTDALTLPSPLLSFSSSLSLISQHPHTDMDAG